MKTYQTTKRKLTKQPNKRLIQEGADALIDLKDKIDTTKMKKPSFYQNEETVVLDGTDGCRSVCLQTSEGWRFSGSYKSLVWPPPSSMWSIVRRHGCCQA